MNNPILVNKQNDHEIRGEICKSNYFRGGYRDYGRYAWCIKYYDFQNNDEIESALFNMFGEYIYSKQGFEYFTELLGRPIKSSTAGRLGGWLVIDTELTERELQKIDEYIASVMKSLPDFLKEERAFKLEQENEAKEIEKQNRIKLNKSRKLKAACKLLRELAGFDVSLSVKGQIVNVQSGLIDTKDEVQHD